MEAMSTAWLGAAIPVTNAELLLTEEQHLPLALSDARVEGLCLLPCPCPPCQSSLNSLPEPPQPALCAVGSHLL